MMNAFQKWLLKQRYFCGIGSCMKRATRVLKDQQGKDVCLCDDCRLPSVSVGETKWDYQPVRRTRT